MNRTPPRRTQVPGRRPSLEARAGRRATGYLSGYPDGVAEMPRGQRREKRPVLPLTLQCLGESFLPLGQKCLEALYHLQRSERIPR